MPQNSSRSGGRWHGRRGRSALLLALLSLGASAALGGAAEEGDALRPGEIRERTLAAGEKHVYSIQPADAPVLVTVEQRGIKLEIEAQGPPAGIGSDGQHSFWGSEVLLLEGPDARRLTIHPVEKGVAPGRYTIRTEALELADGRRAAFSLMSRAGQEASTKTSEARRRALASFRDAAAAWHALGDRRWEAEALGAVGALEAEEREMKPAVEAYSRALALWQEIGDPYREAALLNERGITRSYIGEVDAAREDLQNALAQWQLAGDRYGEAMTRNGLCYLKASGSLPEALTCLQEPLALFHDLGDLRQEAGVRNIFGGIYDLLGEPGSAQASYEKALALWRQLGVPIEEARTLNNLAVLHRVLGEWQEALRLYVQAREVLASSPGDRLLEAAVLHNAGFAYNNLGEPRRARVFLEQALKLRHEMGERRSEVATLNVLGSVWWNLGEPDKALEHYRRALEVAASLGDRRLEAGSRSGLGEVLLERGDAAGALRELEPALAVLRETGNRRRETSAMQLRGRALARAGQPREALAVFRDVASRCRDLRDRAGEAEALYAVAATERSLGLDKEARADADQAVTRVEELRTGFVSPDLRAAFLATQRRAYSLVIDLHMDFHAAEPGKGEDRAALEVSERVRARSLLDVLSAGGVANARSAAPADLLARRQSLRHRLSAKADQQLKQGGAKAEALGREIETLLAELDGVEAEIRRLDPRYAAVSAPRSMNVEEISRLLDPGTLLLEYSLGEERSYLWAIGAGVFRSFLLPPQREIETLARQFHQELSTVEAGAHHDSAAAALSRILLGPVASELAHDHRLVVVPDAALHLVPFAALPVPGSGEPLLERFEIAYVPSATTLALQRQRLEQRPPAPKWAAVLADPVFAADDPRLAGPSAAGRKSANESLQRVGETGGLLSGFERLPSSRREAESISRLAPAGQVWTALNLAANREAVLSGDLRSYRVVHFATHAVADTRAPELSGLVLSLVDAAGKPQEGFLNLTDIYELDLDADLVVLSGCQTALGKEVRGEGIMGLTRGFLYAGVPRVVASLWKVQDRTTAELMARFYRALWQDHLPAAAALREAQRSLRHDPRYRDAHSWAGFVLQGDWR